MKKKPGNIESILILFAAVIFYLLFFVLKIGLVVAIAGTVIAELIGLLATGTKFKDLFRAQKEVKK